MRNRGLTDFIFLVLIDVKKCAFMKPCKEIDEELRISLIWKFVLGL